MAIVVSMPMPSNLQEQVRMYLTAVPFFLEHLRGHPGPLLTPLYIAYCIQQGGTTYCTRGVPASSVPTGLIHLFGCHLLFTPAGLSLRASPLISSPFYLRRYSPHRWPTS